MATEPASSALDPVQLSVMANRLDGIVREMTNTLLRAALLREGGTDVQRVTHAYARVFGRPPTARESAAALSYVQGYAGELGAAGDARQQAWQSFCQALFCANEFLYVD